jgi:hypothetical protein
LTHDPWLSSFEEKIQTMKKAFFKIASVLLFHRAFELWWLHQKLYHKGSSVHQANDNLKTGKVIH